MQTEASAHDISPDVRDLIFRTPSGQPISSDYFANLEVGIASVSCVGAANEYGATASAKLYGVEILNEGFGSSVDDSVLEMQATFIARTVAPLQAVGRTSLL